VGRSDEARLGEGRVRFAVEALTVRHPEVAPLDELLVDVSGRLERGMARRASASSTATSKRERTGHCGPAPQGVTVMVPVISGWIAQM